MKAMKGIGALVAIAGVVLFAIGVESPGSNGGYEAIGMILGCVGCLAFGAARFFES